MLNSEQRRERDTGDGQQGKMFLVLWELSFKKAGGLWVLSAHESTAPQAKRKAGDDNRDGA